MANHLKVFADETAYSAFTASTAYVTPNVSVCSGGSNSLFYNPKDYSLDYFTTVAKSDGTINFSGSSSNTLSYSTDNGATWSSPAQTPEVSVSVGDKVLWKGNCTPIAYNGIGKFTTASTSAQFDVEGNVMSLLYGDNFKGQTSLEEKNYAFYGLICGNTNVISAENLSLPATELAKQCYRSMFDGCTSLTTAPELPATTLDENCYYQMFSNCTSLISAPVLPAMTLEFSCYSSMFQGCTSLTTAPQLPATTLTSNCYASMFAGCTSLTTAPELPATTMTSLRHCYASMFACCTSLTTAPELPATELTVYCYSYMFSGCTSLTTAPVLPATTLAYGCYNQMFFNCTSLNSITCLATDISASDCTNKWVKGVASSGTFTKAAGMTGWTTGGNGTPSGWTVVDNA